jgi:hypothetical protein
MSVGQITHKYRRIERKVEGIEASLDDANFINNGEGEFDNLYLQGIDDNLNSGVRCEKDERHR